jgi:hypothetical protein
MRYPKRDPTLLEDISALADLYVAVFGMMGKRVSESIKPRKTSRPNGPREPLVLAGERGRERPG